MRVRALRGTMRNASACIIIRPCGESIAVRFKVAGEATGSRSSSSGARRGGDSQHPVNPAAARGSLSDQNTYLVAKAGDDVVSMVAIRADRPFSLDQKLGCSIRRPAPRLQLRLSPCAPRRQTLVFKGLVDLIIDRPGARIRPRDHFRRCGNRGSTSG